VEGGRGRDGREAKTKAALANGRGQDSGGILLNEQAVSCRRAWRWDAPIRLECDCESAEGCLV